MPRKRSAAYEGHVNICLFYHHIFRRNVRSHSTNFRHHRHLATKWFKNQQNAAK
ncbi:hypothetical protein [Vibrio vulnificus]|uniref:hypothetical protein n=1 Tax=Vibrio vulnificus TaxID=672 RepID=UPI000A868848|nr:hypothetical protein [Vibrio vulnificus]